MELSYDVVATCANVGLTPFHLITTQTFPTLFPIAVDIIRGVLEPKLILDHFSAKVCERNDKVAACKYIFTFSWY